MTAPGSTLRPALLAPDPELPFRDAVLDGATAGPRLLGVLGLRPDVPVGPVTRMRAKYQPGRSLRVAWSVQAGAHSRVVSTRMVPASRWSRLLARSGAGAIGPEGRDGITADPDLTAVSWVFPLDRRLRSLPDVWGRTGPVRAAVGRGWRHSRLMAYAPEKAATLCCLDDDGRPLAYVKVYADAGAAGDVPSRMGAAAVLPRRGPVAVPRLLAVLPDHRALVFEAASGRRLDGLPAAELPDATAALGRGLAVLHALDAGGLPPLTRFAPDCLGAAARLIDGARPDVGGLAEDVAAALEGTLPDGGPFGGATLVHGDAHLPNALLTADGVTLVDFDQAAAGHPAADVGSVLAGLRRARIVGQLPADDEAELARRFLLGYAEGAGPPGSGPLDPAAVRWHTAAALLVERAARAVGRVQPDVLARLDEVLSEALDVALGARP